MPIAPPADGRETKALGVRPTSLGPTLAAAVGGIRGSGGVLTYRHVATAAIVTADDNPYA